MNSYSNNMDGWTSELFVDALDKSKKPKLKKLFARDYLPKGRFPVIDQGQQFISGWTNDESLVIKSNLPFIVFGDHTRCFKLVDSPFALGADGTQLLKPKTDFEPHFFYYACLNLQLPNRGYNRHFTVLKERFVPKPPLAQQLQIAALLYKIEDAIRMEEKLESMSRELMQSALSKIFSVGLYNEGQKNSEIGLVPATWELLQVSDLISQNIIEKPLDGNHGEKHPKKLDFVSSGVPFVMASDLNDGEIDLRHCNFLSKSLADTLSKGFAKPDDVLISHKGTIGRTAIVQNGIEDYVMLTPQVTYYRIINANRLNNVYLKYYFDSPAFQLPFKTVAGDGSTRAYIGITRQQEMYVLVPSIEEQKEVASIFQSLDKKILLHKRKRSLYSELFQSLLSQLMTGQISAADLDIDTSDITS